MTHQLGKIHHIRRALDLVGAWEAITEDYEADYAVAALLKEYLN